MLSLPHLVVLFIIALIIFGPQKLPELARMLGKATAEFRKMTNDFQVHSRRAKCATWSGNLVSTRRKSRRRPAQSSLLPAPPQGAMPRELPAAEGPTETIAELPPQAGADPSNPETVTVPHEKPTDDAAV